MQPPQDDLDVQLRIVEEELAAIQKEVHTLNGSSSDHPDTKVAASVLMSMSEVSTIKKDVLNVVKALEHTTVHSGNTDDANDRLTALSAKLQKLSSDVCPVSILFRYIKHKCGKWIVTLH